MEDSSVRKTKVKTKTKKTDKSKKHKEQVDDHRHDDSNDDEQTQIREREKYLRRKEKRVLKLREMGLDENGDPLDNFSISKYPVREAKLKLPGSQQHVALNPVVFILSVMGLWGLVLWCSANPGGAMNTLFSWRSLVATNCDWFLIGFKAIMFFFILYITYMYGTIHLGRKGETPEFGNRIYFCMILTSTMGPLLLTNILSDMMGFRSAPFFSLAGHRTQDEVDLFAINMTVANSVILNLTPYVLVAIGVSLAGLRFQLPMTFRSCFYTVCGSYTWGWMGDVVDTLSIVVTVLGCSIYLALSTFSISAGLQYIGWIGELSTEEETRRSQNMIIWIITIVSTISVLYGMLGAIQIMSCLAVSLSTLLLFLIFVMDDTKFVLNLMVQEVGYLLQTNLFQYNFWTDAFGQLEKGNGHAVDDTSGAPDWMDNWTTFYMAWTYTTAASVGMFIASISRGRKLWEVVAYTFGAAGVYTMIWICIWAGTGLRHHRQGQELAMIGETYYNNSAHFLVDGSEVCYDVPQESIVIGDDVVFANVLPGVTPVCQFDPYMGTLNMLNAFRFPESFPSGGIGYMLTGLYVVCVALSYMANSDSSTLMVDCLASNGRKNYHWVRRMFWASTVGAVATALLSSGDGNSLVAIQSASYAFGLLAAILMCYIPYSVIVLCRASKVLDQDATYEFPDQAEFAMPLYGGVFNIVEHVVSLRTVDTSNDKYRITRLHVTEFLKGFVVPFVSMKNVLTHIYPNNGRRNKLVVGCYSLCYYGACILWLVSWSRPGIQGCMWALFVVAGLILATVRTEFRKHCNLRSNIVADLISSAMLWPQVLAQLQVQLCTMMTDETNDAQSKSTRKTMDTLPEGSNWQLEV